MERLTPLGAVGELKQAGERAPVLTRVEENGVLKIDAVGEEVVVLIHPGKEINSGFVKGCNSCPDIVVSVVQQRRG